MTWGDVEILFEKLIKPATATPDPLQIFKLSFLDQTAPHSYASLLYFYHPADQDDGKTSISSAAEISERLEKSLSLVLTRFYPLSGRISLSEGGDIIDSVNCQDQGVLYRETRLNCQLNAFLKEAYEDTNLIHLLAPRKLIDNVDDLLVAPLVRVQLSKFECGGLVLSVQTLHTVGDGFTGTTFTSEWAKISRFGMMNDPRFLIFDVASSVLPTINDISRKIELFPPPNRRPQVKTVMKRFVFDEAAIARLKDEIMATNCSLLLERQPTKVEVVTALIWRSLIRAAQARHGYLRPSMTSLS
ncbi:hypothetical protein ACH5RR_041386 [Cinchona calisaya]|uniref:Uncharacterized protein n=1 Tax=Cinchona calisaya TaxID=153742 RepID=A0ABD2XWQ5_9GENT